MNRSLIVKKYGMFVTGLVFAALGISLITKAGLGTSPITSPAYVLTFLFPKSLGTFTFLINSLMFVLEAVILGKNFRKIQLLQLPATLIFSACIDLWMFVFSFWHSDLYIGKLVLLLIGCTSLGLGIAFEVIPNVLILPGEGLVRAISQRMNWVFGHVKTTFDLGLVASAALLSFLTRGELLGIREGTVIAALIVGTIANFFIRRISALPACQKHRAAALRCESPSEV